MDLVRPYVVVFATCSLDGRIATKARDSKLSCPEDKRRQCWLRSKVDAIVVGANTVIVDDPRLYPKEFKHARPRYYRVVLDGKLRVPTSARIFDTSTYPTIVVTTEMHDREKAKALRERGVEIVIAGRGPRIDLVEAMKILSSSYGISTMMVEGGGETIWSFVETRIVDEMRITYRSIVVGGRNAVPLVAGEGFESVDEAFRFRPVLVGLCTCREEVHVIYRATNPIGVPVEEPRIGTLMNFAYVLDLGIEER